MNVQFLLIPDPRSRRRQPATPRIASPPASPPRPLLPPHTYSMVSLPILSQTARSAASATKSLATSMRALSLAARPAALPAIQTRCLSQAALATRKTALSAGAVAPAVQSGVAVFQKVQTRGMKVRSAIKKRCEHCKVRRTRSGAAWLRGRWHWLTRINPACRSSDGKRTSDTTATSTSSARPTRGTSNARARRTHGGSVAGDEMF